MGVNCCDIRSYSIGPPRPNQWLGRSSCWYDRTSLWDCDYVQNHGKSYLEHLPALVALNSPLRVEIILCHSQMKFFLAVLLVWCNGWKTRQGSLFYTISIHLAFAYLYGLNFVVCFGDDDNIKEDTLGVCVCVCVCVCWLHSARSE
jgi:hypothetical protein